MTKGKRYAKKKTKQKKKKKRKNWKRKVKGKWSFLCDFVFHPE